MTEVNEIEDLILKNQTKIIEKFLEKMEERLDSADILNKKYISEIILENQEELKNIKKQIPHLNII